MALGYLVANVIVVLLLGWKLKRQNRERAAVAEEVTDVGNAEDWKGDADPRWRFAY